MAVSWRVQELIEDPKWSEYIRMATPNIGNRKAAEVIEQETGRPCSSNTVWRVVKGDSRNGSKGIGQRPGRAETTDDEDLEGGEIPIGDLIEQRKSAHGRKAKRAKVHDRSVLMDPEPFGVLVMGDPHVDNDGCDWNTLHEHVELVQGTEGMFAACVGDMTDNWIGRLAKLYANSTMRASDGWRLSKWLLESMPWLILVGGNHDAWSVHAGADPLGWIAKDAGVMCYAPDDVRVTMRWRGEPDLEPLVWWVRHDFRGRSWFHPTHGPHKESMLDGEAHALIAGHIHQWGELGTEHRRGRCSLAVRVRGYKANDTYAIEKGFHQQIHGAACVIVVDPRKTGPGRQLCFWDVKQGAEYLTMLRGLR